MNGSGRSGEMIPAFMHDYYVHETKITKTKINSEYIERKQLESDGGQWELFGHDKGMGRRNSDSI